ncbi:MAG TPA: translation elongation factor Ts [Firmicutes bacterium]|nr:translation elongation factor Ts [Bacillota bacterium]
MAQITGEMVKELRERTGAGMLDCKKALEATGGNMEKAVEELRKKGLAAAVKRSGRIATEGVIEAYVHGDGRIGVLVEVNCETDFVAKTEDFRHLARDLAMQVAAARPEYVGREAVPAEVVARELDIYRAAARNEGKPEPVVERIAQGRLEKFYQEVCLLEQPFIKDPGKKVKDVIMESVARLGENITVRRFVRFERGEGLGENTPA